MLKEGRLRSRAQTLSRTLPRARRTLEVPPTESRTESLPSAHAHPTKAPPPQLSSLPCGEKQGPQCPAGTCQEDRHDVALSHSQALHAPGRKWRQRAGTCGDSLARSPVESLTGWGRWNWVEKVVDKHPKSRMGGRGNKCTGRGNRAVVATSVQCAVQCTAPSLTAQTSSSTETQTQ